MTSPMTAHEGAPSEPFKRPVTFDVDIDDCIWIRDASFREITVAGPYMQSEKDIAEFVRDAINAYEPAHATPTEAPGVVEPLGWVVVYDNGKGDRDLWGDFIRDEENAREERRPILVSEFRGQIAKGKRRGGFIALSHGLADALLALLEGERGEPVAWAWRIPGGSVIGAQPTQDLASIEADRARDLLRANIEVVPLYAAPVARVPSKSEGISTGHVYEDGDDDCVQCGEPRVCRPVEVRTVRGPSESEGDGHYVDPNEDLHEDELLEVAEDIFGEMRDKGDYFPRDGYVVEPGQVIDAIKRARSRLSSVREGSVEEHETKLRQGSSTTPSAGPDLLEDVR